MYIKKRRALGGAFELAYKKKAFGMFRETLKAIGVGLILPEPDWTKPPEEMGDRDYIITEMLCEIGNDYHSRVPNDF